MFTGIVTEIGRVKNITRKASSARLEISCEKIGENLDIGDSVAVNGACLSIVGMKEGALSFDAIGNTLSKTSLKRLKVGDKVNLESALKLGDTLGGHMVSGHIDGERMVKNSRRTPQGWILDIALLAEDKKYVVAKGSVAIDGVSLTVGEAYTNSLRIYIIPHTLEKTTLLLKKSGDYVNLEIDMMSKYVREKSSGREITIEMLRDKGFM